MDQEGGDNTQTANDVRTTLYGRCYDVKTRKRLRYDAVLTSCTGWVRIEKSNLCYIQIN